jgi:hypothetical protein
VSVARFATYALASIFSFATYASYSQVRAAPVRVDSRGVRC